MQSDHQTKLINRVRARLERGERISTEDCRDLFGVRDLTSLARLARIPRERKFGRRAFFRALDPVSYADASSGSAVMREGAVGLAVGCASEDEPLQVWEERFRALARSATPAVPFISAGFVARLAERESTPVGKVLSTLRAASPFFLNGNEAELFDPALRSASAPRAMGAQEWLAVHRAAHILGIGSGASMVYTVEDHPEAYAAHLDAIRSLQDETGGFLQFVPMAVHNMNVREFYLSSPTASQTFRAVAIARIFLDNIAHIAVPPALVTAEIAYVALSYGADTIDPTISVGDPLFSERPATGGTELTVMTPTPARPPLPTVKGIRERIDEARWNGVPLYAFFEQRATAEIADIT